MRCERAGKKTEKRQTGMLQEKSRTPALNWVPLPPKDQLCLPQPRGPLKAETGCSGEGHPQEPHTMRERWECGPNSEAQVLDRALPTTPSHQQKALHSACISELTTCWWASPCKWSRRRKQMAQGQAHLPHMRSKVTTPLGCLPVLPVPTTPGVVVHLPAACTHFLCPSVAEVQGPRA